MRINIQTKVPLLLAVALTLAVVGSAAAQEGEITPCEGENVSGTVVAVDEETGVVTIDTGGDLCTVTLDDEYDHPIVALLGSYFGGVSAENLAAALEATQGCAVQDPDSEGWTWSDCEADDAVIMTVIAENEDGTFTATVEGEEMPIIVTVEDSATAEGLSEALQALAAEWELDDDGSVIQSGDEIAAYHEDGLGFGVLVKLYAMAAESEEACVDAEEPCGVTAEELVEAFQSGMSMGQLFKEYGRPSIVGIGHVRQSEKEHGPVRNNKDKDNTGPPDHAGPKDNKNNAGPPDHAGPKDNKNNAGPPDHAGPKGNKNNAGPKK